MHVVIQKVFKDELTYESTQSVDRVGHVYNSINQFAADVKTVYDPVLKKDVSASGAGIAGLIRAFAHNWLAEKYDGATNEHGDFILNG